jgi:hypothetical protein
MPSLLFYKVGMKKNHLVLLLFAVAILISSCAPSTAELDSQFVLETVIAQTVQALPTQTPVPSLTATLWPTSARPSATLWVVETPTQAPMFMPSLTPFPTVPPPIVVPTIKPGPRQGSYNFACKVLSYNPVHYYNISPGQRIRVGWFIKNDGVMAWDHNSIDIALRSGENLAIRGKRVDLEVSVAAGAGATIAIDIQVPDKPGEYVSHWSLVRGDQSFCKVSFHVHVVK